MRIKPQIDYDELVENIRMKKNLLTAICLVIYTFFEVLIVLLDVCFLTLLFVMPNVLGFYSKKHLAYDFSVLCLVVGVALLGVGYVYRKHTQNFLKHIFRPISERLIEKLRSINFFKSCQ